MPGEERSAVDAVQVVDGEARPARLEVRRERVVDIDVGDVPTGGPPLAEKPEVPAHLGGEDVLRAALKGERGCEQGRVEDGGAVVEIAVGVAREELELGERREGQAHTVRVAVPLRVEGVVRSAVDEVLIV